MCESKVYIRNGKEELVMEESSLIEVDKDKVKIYGMFGERMEVKGKIVKIDLLNHEVLIERLA